MFDLTLILCLSALCSEAYQLRRKHYEEHRSRFRRAFPRRVRQDHGGCRLADEIFETL